MEFLRFNFGHPFKGKASLTQLLSGKPQSLFLAIDSLLSNVIEIPVTTCGKGKWKVTLDWEYDNRVFSHQEEFEITEDGLAHTAED